MRIQNINSQASYFNRNTNSKITPTATSFKSGLGAYALIRIAIADRSATITGNKKIKYLKTLESYISRSGGKEYLEGLAALSKTPDSFYDYNHQGFTSWLDSIKGTGVKYVNELRDMAFRNFSKTPDDSYSTIQTKKEFITSYFDNGHEINTLFFEEFKKLNDAHYGTFKHETIDKCFYSSKYNQIRTESLSYRLCPTEYSANCDPFNQKGYVSNSSEMYDPNENYVDQKGVLLEQLYNNLKLVSVLDKNKHRYYIESRRGIIDQSKQKLEDYFDKLGEKDLLYKIPNLLNDYNANIKNI